jgi:hypothetical protein
MGLQKLSWHISHSYLVQGREGSDRKPNEPTSRNDEVAAGISHGEVVKACGRGS